MMKGQTLLETALVLAIVGIVATVALARAGDFFIRVTVENEANRLAADLRDLQEQSRSKGYRTLELAHFYEFTADYTMYFDEGGYTVRSGYYKFAYRHDLPASLELRTLRNALPTGISINFGVDGGSVQNNTLMVVAKDNPAIYRYVIVSSAGRVRVSKEQPSAFER